jgi:hypothetical protein
MGHRLSNGLEMKITGFCLFLTLPWAFALSSQAVCGKCFIKDGALYK